MPNDLLPFAELGALPLVIVYVAIFLSFIIRGAFGFGSNLPFVLVTAWILGPHHAIVLSVVVAVFSQVHLAHQGVHSADWSVFRSLILGLLAGAALGAAVFASLNADWLTLTMAALIVSILVLNRFGVFRRLDDAFDLRAPRIAFPLAALSGTVGSVSGGGGMYLLVAYLRVACTTAAALRGTNLMLSVFYQVGRFVTLAVAGYVDARVLIEGVSLLPAVFAGTIVGTRFFQRASDERFFNGVQLVLLFAALALFVKGLIRVLGSA